MDREETYEKLLEMLQVDPVVLQRARYTEDELTTLFNAACKAFDDGNKYAEKLWGVNEATVNASSAEIRKTEGILNRLAQSVNTRALLKVLPDVRPDFG